MSKKSKGSKRPQRKHKRLSQEIVLKYLSQRNEPANTKAIAETLGRVGKQGRQETFEVLEQLRDDDKVTQLSKHRWAMKHAIKEHTGLVVGHVDGHGYVLTDETKEKVYLRSPEMQEVLHNDRVKVRIVGRDRRKKLFGKIIDIVERGNLSIVGRYYNENNINFVVPDDQRIGQDIFVLPEHTMDAKSGQVVMVTITRHPTKNFQPVGEITEVLGDYLAPGMEIEIAMRKHQLPHTWSPTVLKELEKFKESVSPNEFKGRKDIRSLPLVTIDGEDARDFDDAVFCEQNDDGSYRLIVAIADVSSYVEEGSALDQEAWQRGNSVYFPSTVIPMLPEVLSNGLCSLNPNVDRLCFCCDMTITADGEIDQYDFYQAVMFSHARLTYTQVAALMDGKPKVSNIAEELHQPIAKLAEVASKLGKARRQFGAIEFEIPEPVIVFDEERKIDKVIARTRNDAHRLIEECMLAANICASLLLDESGLTGMFRVHEEPDEDKIKDTKNFLRQFKLLMGGGDNPQPKDYAEIVNKLTDPVIAKVVQTALLRSLKQARYDIENKGHFALNFDSYTHFTSPIRRYSDLVVHRQIRKFLADHEAVDDDARSLQLQQTADQVSMTERRADGATRDVVQWLKCEFMSHKIGEKFNGVVTSVTDFGLFVELSDFYVEGLVHITSLSQDYYQYDNERRQLIGESSGKVYKTGQSLEVQLSRVDMDQGRIDFSLTDVQQHKHQSQQRRKSNHKAKRKRQQKNKGR